MESTNRITTYLVVLLISILIGMTLIFTIGSVKDIQTKQVEYSKTKDEDQTLFAKYNEDYKSKVKNEEDGRLVILEFNVNSNIEETNRVIVNYLSNVGGKLVSVNGYDVKDSTSSLSVAPVITTNGLGLGLIPRSHDTIRKRNQYVILVPKDAPAADNLQRRINVYLDMKKDS